MKTSHIRSGSCWAAHEANYPLARGAFDDLRKPLAHDLLELHALLDDRVAAAPREQRLLDAREAPSQHTHDQIVLEVGLRAGRPTPVELLQQRDHPVRDRGEDIAVTAGDARSVLLTHLGSTCTEVFG